MTLSEAAEHFNVNLRTIQRWAKSGKLKSRKQGRDLLILQEEEGNVVVSGKLDCGDEDDNLDGEVEESEYNWDEVFGEIAVEKCRKICDERKRLEEGFLNGFREQPITLIPFNRLGFEGLVLEEIGKAIKKIKTSDKSFEVYASELDRIVDEVEEAYCRLHGIVSEECEPDMIYE